MSYTFRKGDRAALLTRTITATAAGVITYSGTDFTNPVGAIFEISGSSDTDNNRVGYVCVAFNAGANTVTLRPAPDDGAGTLGSLIMRTRTADKGGADTLASVVDLGGNLYCLTVTGATFLTDNVLPNDYLEVGRTVTDSVAANNGLWLIHGRPLSETQVVVRRPDNGAGMTADAASDGSVHARTGTCVLTITDEAAPTWSAIVAGATSVLGPSGTAAMGSGSMSDYIWLTPIGAARTNVNLFGMGDITIITSGLGADATWLSSNENVLQHRVAGHGTGGDLLAANVLNLIQGAGSFFTLLQLGVHDGDEFSAEDGSAWSGISKTVAGNQIRFALYGSYWDNLNAAGNQIQLGQDTVVLASILRGNANFSSAGGHEIKFAILYGLTPLLLFTAATMRNVLVSGMTGDAVLAGDQTFEELRLSDQVTGRWSATTLTLLNPQEDYDIDTLVAFQLMAAAGFKDYTFNPRFVAAASPSSEPTPLENMTVTIFEVDTVGGETLVFRDLTDANGQLNAGAGVQLTRQQRALAVDGSGIRSHRIVVEGAGIRTQNTLREITAKFVADIPVPRLVTNFEEEFDPT